MTLKIGFTGNKFLHKGIELYIQTKSKVNYSIVFSLFKESWCEIWTPYWHEGRGKYITIGFYFIGKFKKVKDIVMYRS